MTLVLNSQAVEASTDMSVLISALEAGFAAEARGELVMPPRLNLPTDDGIFRIMPAVLKHSGLMGFKAFHGSLAQGARYLIAVYEPDGRLLALMDAHYLTAARTGATTGVATSALARADARTAAVLGSGLEARTNLQAVCAVRPIAEARVFSPNVERRDAFVRRMRSELGISIVAADNPQMCVQGADIVVVATNTSAAVDPIAFRGRWAEPGMHVNAIGSTLPQLRELDVDTFWRADRIVVDSAVQVRNESGDVIAAVAEGAYPDEKEVELKDVVAEPGRGRMNDQQITLFKSVGTAMQDVVAGGVVHEAARRDQRGTDIGEFLDLKTF